MPHSHWFKGIHLQWILYISSLVYDHILLEVCWLHIHIIKGPCNHKLESWISICLPSSVFRIPQSIPKAGFLLIFYTSAYQSNLWLLQPRFYIQFCDVNLFKHNWINTFFPAINTLFMGNTLPTSHIPNCLGFLHKGLLPLIIDPCQANVVGLGSIRHIDHLADKVVSISRLSSAIWLKHWFALREDCSQSDRFLHNSKDLAKEDKLADFDFARQVTVYFSKECNFTSVIDGIPVLSCDGSAIL